MTVSMPRLLALGELFSNPTRGGRDTNESPAADMPHMLARRAAFAVARAWKVSPELVRLRWGAIRDVDVLSDATEFRLIGHGSDGWFAVVFDCGDRPGFAARLRAGVMEKVPFAARTLEPGAEVGRLDIEYREEVRWGAPATIGNQHASPGWRVHQTIEVGKPIAEPAALPTPVVRRGERVKLQWKRNMITVSLEGTALHDASTGYGVAVSLKGRKGSTRGIVTGPGQARLEC